MSNHEESARDNLIEELMGALQSQRPVSIQVAGLAERIPVQDATHSFGVLKITGDDGSDYMLTTFDLRLVIVQPARNPAPFEFTSVPGPRYT